MKTDDFIRVLATGASITRAPRVLVRYMNAIALGSIGAFCLLVAMLNLRADLDTAILMPQFQFKLLFLLSLVGAGLLIATRLSRPGLRLGLAPIALAAPIVIVWVVSSFVLANADASERATLFFGNTWQTCSFFIAVLSVPIFFALIWATKGLAPTRLRLAGAAVGLLSGAVAALVYSLHCPEVEAPFIGFWYLLGMLIPTAVGALSGRFLLRW